MNKTIKKPTFNKLSQPVKDLVAEGGNLLKSDDTAMIKNSNDAKTHNRQREQHDKKK